jgi:hypothetical protein
MVEMTKLLPLFQRKSDYIEPDRADKAVTSSKTPLRLSLGETLTTN